ncbi:MAG: hypothetical protein A2Y77_17045 [Planctomycetes bacterium RBG_13_62_9]|nr:MAG: hypothetical protein A2Y77_17045 [Planctomycetes bacterium RBG_13_62_9]
MGITHLTDRTTIEAFLRRNPELHIYSLGDLDDFFWPYTTWYGWEEDAQLRDIALVYKGQPSATVVGISARPATMRKLLRAITPLLPQRFYAHLSPGMERVFEGTHQLDSHGPHHKMALHDRSCVLGTDCSQAVRLTHRDLDDLLRLYDESYPANWFDPRRLGFEIVAPYGEFAIERREQTVSYHPER